MMFKYHHEPGGSATWTLACKSYLLTSVFFKLVWASSSNTVEFYFGDRAANAAPYQAHISMVLNHYCM